MKIVLYTDCMSIDAQVAEHLRYPAILQNKYPDDDFITIDLDDQTTHKALENMDKVTSAHPDIVVFAFGVNNALPRGLTRRRRDEIIRWSYKVGMTKKLRLLYRKFLLNPVEYVM